jgi:2,4-dienoyl-CoA reductase-like NADH-dependent reductase (Old Yellow Enzyme family)
LDLGFTTLRNRVVMGSMHRASLKAKSVQQLSDAKRAIRQGTELAAKL